MGCRGFPARAVPPYEAVTAGPGKRGRHQVRAAIRLRRSHSHIFSGLSAPPTFIGSARKHEFVWASTISARYRADAVGSATPRQHRQPCPFRTSEAGGPSCTAHGLQPRHHSAFRSIARMQAKPASTASSTLWSRGRLPRAATGLTPHGDRGAPSPAPDEGGLRNSELAVEDRVPDIGGGDADTLPDDHAT